VVGDNCRNALSLDQTIVAGGGDKRSCNPR